MTEHDHMHLSISANVGGGQFRVMGALSVSKPTSSAAWLFMVVLKAAKISSTCTLCDWQALEIVASALTAHISQLMFRFFSSGGSQATRSACDFESVASPASTRSKSS